MTDLQQLTQELNLQENEVLLFQPIEDLYHPIAWLESVGQFLGNEISHTLEISAHGRTSVQQEINI